MPRPLSFVLWVQALFYLLTGLWPLVHLASFEAVTGPKVDDWLVRMVGLLTVVIGAVLALALRARRVTPEVALLAAGAAASYAAIDFTYALGNRIRDVYLLDGVVEVVFVVAGVGAWVASGQRDA
jgi:hypothetical protein